MRKSQRLGHTRSDGGGAGQWSDEVVSGGALADSSERPWSASKRTWISIVLAFHVFAVVVGPWSAPPPASSLSGLVASWLSPYLFSLHINHGYRFFAPNPGPSHLVRYEVTQGEEQLAEGSFPSRQTNWPRLMYHRYFMTSESMYGLSERVLNPPEAPPKPAEGELIDPLVQDEYAAILVAYEREKKKSTLLADGIARQWQAAHPGADVRLWVVEHGIAAPRAVEQGMPLSDPSLYRERLLGEWKQATP